MAKVAPGDRKKYSATNDGRFPIKNKAQAVSAIKLRGHAGAPGSPKRMAVLRRAAKFAPAMAKAAMEADRKAGGKG